MTRERQSVLLVDDEPDNLVALTAVLEPLDRELVQAGSGEEALKLLLAREFAVILLDVRMPGLDGFETAALIKQRERTRHIPIIFVTAVSKDTEHVFRGYSEGAVDYLLKPYDPAVLRSKVLVFVELYEQNAAGGERGALPHGVRQRAQRHGGRRSRGPPGAGEHALAEMVGRSQEDLEGSRWESIIHPDERAQDREAIRELMAGERPVYAAERRCLHADGHVLLVALSVTSMSGPDRRPVELIAQLEDVTARKRAEEERAQRLREQAARAEAEVVADMVRNLQNVSDTALAHLALDDLLPELLERIAEILRADSASVLLSDGDEGLVVRATRGVATAEVGAQVPLGRTTFAGRVARERRPIVITDGDGEGELRSLIGVPLIAEGEVSGVVLVGSRSAHRFDDNDAALLALVADRAALAIGNASLYEREHRVVETLQRSLLPAKLPRLPGLAIAAHYSPGGADVGGDWYDAIELRGGGVGMAMGDVVGHGIEARIAHGRAPQRLARLRAREHIAGEGAGQARPADVADGPRGHGDAGLRRRRPGLDEPALRRRRASAAAAPRPGRQGRVPLGRPLAAAGGGRPEGVAEGTAAIDPGSTLALYTDGLVEVRGEMLTAGLDRLRDAVASGPEEPKALCAHVIESLLGDRVAGDDVAFLALRTTPLAREVFRIELPTDRTSLAYARRILARWLEQAGAAPGDSFEIQLASHEACANAIEHAHKFGDALVELEGRLLDQEVALTVRDRGSWREQADDHRGRGLDLMNALMDGVTVNGGPDGTEVELRRRLRGQPSET